MKALELIEQIEDVEENKYHKTRTIIFDSNDMVFIKEAKSEIEALRQPKSCEGCKNAVFPLPKICFNCERKSADLYEAKDK